MILLQGDAAQVLRGVPDKTCRACITSPPYYGLRDYGMDGQIGVEQTPEEYIDRLVEVFREVRRVLTDDGTLWLNVGDSYATRSGPQPPTNTRNKHGHTAKAVPTGYKQKDLIGIPWALAFALRADGWYLRQDIIWHKTNPMPESVRDRCTKSHEYIFLLSKKPRYYFNGAAISEPIAGSSTKRYLQNIAAQHGSERQPGKNKPMKAALPRFGGEKYGESEAQEARTKSGREHTPTPRRNKRDVWEISTAGYKGAHFATFPEKLAELCILAATEPGDVVLDPFLGSGTTAAVATRLLRLSIGIDINPQYLDIAAERVNKEREAMTK